MNPNTKSLEKIAIVGAGLGGLACAVALHNKGFNVEVYEKAQDFRPVGGGLGLLPNGSKILDKIHPGIVEEIKNLSCHVKETVLKNTQGETIRTSSASRFEDNYGYPLIAVWWWRLQQTLASKLPLNIIHLNHRCTGFSQDDEGVNIYFENQEDTKKTVRADLLIGADGIKSVVRANLIADGEANFLNSMSWRAVIKNNPKNNQKNNQELLNSEQMGFVRGHREFMYLLNVGQGDIAWLYRQQSSDYSLSANKDEAKSRVLDKIADWGKPLRSLVEATPSERILEGGICDRLPIDSWSKGRVVLLGDSAHPMAPAAGQGANSSFEDAWVLADCLSNASSINEAFINYEKRRIPRLKIIQNRSKKGEMRYYETESERLERQQQQPDEMSSEEFAQFVHNSPI